LAPVGAVVPKAARASDCTHSASSALLFLPNTPLPPAAAAVAAELVRMRHARRRTTAGSPSHRASSSEQTGTSAAMTPGEAAVPPLFEFCFFFFDPRWFGDVAVTFSKLFSSFSSPWLSLLEAVAEVLSDDDARSNGEEAPFASGGGAGTSVAFAASSETNSFAEGLWARTVDSTALLDKACAAATAHSPAPCSGVAVTDGC